MRIIVLFVSVLMAGSLLAQKTGINTAKLDLVQLPTLPVADMKSVGIEIYTGSLPYNRDTLRLYLGNMDVLKSGGDRLSKASHKSFGEVDLVGGKGDITFTMAFGKASIGSKEMKEAACTVAKEGCKQYFYTVQYKLPAVVQASNSSGVLDTWELKEDLALRFGNEQVETQSASTTTVRVVSFASPEDLEKGFESQGEAWMVRKGALVQLKRMIEEIYTRVFFEEEKMKFDIAYGKGGDNDYSETESASLAAVSALESQNFDDLKEPIAVWETWLERYDPADKKAPVNFKVAKGLNANLSIAYTFTGEYDKARSHINEALTLAYKGTVNSNEINKLKAFNAFIDVREMGMKNNGTVITALLVPGPDIKKTLGRRKFNKDIDFIFPDDKYVELASAISEEPKEEKPAGGMEGMMAAAGATSYADRAQSGTLVLSSIFDGGLKGGPIPESVCDLSDLKTLNARNIGLTGVPDCIGQLSNLEKLIIDGNAISELPDIFGSFSKLTTVNISDNKLTALPESFYGLKLKKLTISGNNLSKDVMDKIAASMPDCKIK